MQNENDNDLIKKKVDIFFNSATLVHIKFKKGYWKRGLIKEISSDFFMLDERLEGIMPVFFQEIVSIEKFKEEEKGYGST